jgi:hypothetical protein
MKKKPKTKECSTPPDRPVWHRAWRLDEHGKRARRGRWRGKAKTWMLAREDAMKHLGCGPQQLHVEREPERKRRAALPAAEVTK